ncbi:MAG: hypothetical protein ACLR4X_11655 [Clostridia bacterium]
MKVYIVTEIYFSEEGVHREVKCICKDKNTARDKMKEYAKKQLEEQFEYEEWKITSMKNYECVLEGLYETLVLKVEEWEVI